MAFCDKCKREYPEGFTNCPDCGLKVGGEATPRKKFQITYGKNWTPSSNRLFNILIFFVILVTLCWCWFYFLFIVPAKKSGTWDACCNNLKNIGTALNMYADDNEGHYPTSLQPLISMNYIRQLPTCFAAEKDTYSNTYTVSRNPDVYTFYCSGNNHKDVNAGENYPQYTSRKGLILLNGEIPDKKQVKR